MSQTLLPYIEINPKTTPKASVIWLHGLGADGNDCASLVPALHLPDHLAVRFIFPHAPMRPVTANNGNIMRAWFDIYAFSTSALQDESGLNISEKNIHALIQQELDRGIASEKILLAGFSQGGAMAFYTGLRYSKRLAGILALSTYMPAAEVLSASTHAANKGLPIFMAHGHRDSVIPLSWAKLSHNRLESLQYIVDWHTYSMEHTICYDEISDMSHWIQKKLK